MKVHQDSIFKDLPAEYDQEVSLHGSCEDKTLVIIDDDPAGCLTVHNIPVLFTWDEETLTSLLKERHHIIFILTNRWGKDQGTKVHTINEVIESLVDAGKEANQEFIVITRCDTIFREYSPDKPEAIDRVLGLPEIIHCLVPVFIQGGRYAYNDIPYVKEGEFFVPLGEAPIADSESAGFFPTDLNEYITEKMEGFAGEEGVFSFSVESLREKGPQMVKEQLLSTHKKVCIVNALAQSDLDVFAAGAWEAIVEGKNMVFHAGASFINSFSCIPVKEPLGRMGLKRTTDAGGVVIVSSRKQRTIVQMQQLLDQSVVSSIELEIEGLLSEQREELVSALAFRSGQLVASGNHVLIYISDSNTNLENNDESVDIEKIVSDAIIEIISLIKTVPSFIVIKGKLTSYEISCGGVKMNSATVIGQAIPGVPVLIPNENKDMKLIVFPDDFGNEDDLLKLFFKLID